MKIINRPNIARMFSRWLDRATIPNSAGFKLLVRLANGSEAQTEVVKDAQGLHVLKDCPITQVAGWMPISKY